MRQPFVHLHTHTEYSLLDGAARISRLIDRAIDLGMPALAITDHGVMYGVIDFYKKAIARGIKPIIGCEVYVAARNRKDRDVQKDGEQHHLVLLAKDLEGYRNLMALVSKAHLEGFYYKPRVDHELLAQYSKGLIALSACLAGEIPSLLLRDQEEQAKERVALYHQIFGKENFYIELQDHGLSEQKKVNRQLIKLAQAFELGLVATNDVHYVNRKDAYLQDVLMCVQMGKTLQDSERMRFQGEEFYLKSAQEMAALFGDYPSALNNTLTIAEACHVDFTFGVNYLPPFPIPQDGHFEYWKAQQDQAPWPNVTWEETEKYLLYLCQQGMARRGISGQQAYEERLAFELQTICRMGFAGYFLIVQDFCNFSRQNDILVGPGRGSAAGSLVSYVLAITDIDPLAYDLLFERFLNPERVSMPDIDIDFDFERRGEVIDYVVKKYGSERVAQIITFGTMAARAAIRDVGRVLNVPLSEVDKVAKAIPAELGMTIEKALKVSPELQKLKENEEVEKLIETAQALEGMPRHASTHAAGVVIAPTKLVDYLPVQRGSDEGVTTQFAKDQVEEIGLLKVDILGLKTLTLVGDAIRKIAKSRGKKVDLKELPLDDAKTYALLGRADSFGVFQLESAGLRAILKELKPSHFEDIVALVALYRPGPLQSGMVDDFIARKHKRKAVEYLHPALEPILKDTYGVILYQEQVMRIASELAGFTLGEADMLRRAMGKKKPEVIAGLRRQFIEGAEKRGIAVETAGHIFDLMEFFAGYGFNKSHSAAYALIAYQTAYLKANYPLEFMAALLTNAADSSEKVAQYIEACRQMSIQVLPPDVNFSDVDFTVVSEKGEKDKIRFGLAAVKNVGKNAIEAILLSREKDKHFRSLVDFCIRVDGKQVNRRVLESLIKAGAMASIGPRRPLLMILDKCMEVAEMRQRDLATGQMNLFDFGAEEAGEDGQKSYNDDVPIPSVTEFPHRDLLTMEKELLGFYFSGHPLEEVRPLIENRTTLPLAQIQREMDQRRVTLGGIIHGLRRTTTKRGEVMAYFTLEDWAGAIEVLVFPRTYNSYSSQLIDEGIVIVEGKIHYEEENKKVFSERLTLLQPEDRISLTYQKAVEAEQCDKVVILRVPFASSEKKTVEALLEILQKHQGATPVQLIFLNDSRAFQLSPVYWVQENPHLQIELENFVGSKVMTIKRTKKRA
ncbi:DNA polymerase III subunit alpha [Heliorestis acidaminivorans]|uniref:DNA polymerase III subunit alpha n=1 Tax=Heliorestis acidaminivorans TaxID=553427 RepID=A0A6I0EV20_9FIRM|nr:DNA polymerase III subunit alpha [Heliorestis acidaminivorans]KAB2953304.1 DNA polymerase III subunit alpha [Heliorestis acidaminivorans]